MGMKIIPNKLTEIQAKKLEQENKKTEKKQSGRSGESMDRITISAEGIHSAEGVHSEDAVPDARFLEKLMNQLMKDIEKKTEQSKLDELKLQVAAGEYDINPTDIVNRMMGDFD